MDSGTGDAGGVGDAGWQVVLLVGLMGALAGIALAVLGDVASRSEIGGENWSLSGNGALVVPLAGGPAVLAGGWAALARWRVLDRRWGLAGLVTGLVTLAVGVLTSFGPVLVVNLFGEEVLAGAGSVLAALAITFLLPLTLAVVGGLGLTAAYARPRRAAVVTALATVGAGAVLLGVLPGAFFFLGPLLLPFMTGLPLVVASRRQEGRVALFSPGWLGAACVALVVTVIGGLVLAQWVQTR